MKYYSSLKEVTLGDTIGIGLGSNQQAILSTFPQTSWLLLSQSGYLLPRGIFFFFLSWTLGCFFRSEDLLIYVFIPFCLNYKGRTCPSSLYISLSCWISSLLAWQDRVTYTNQSHPSPRNTSEVYCFLCQCPVRVQVCIFLPSFFLSLTTLFEQTLFWVNSGWVRAPLWPPCWTEMFTVWLSIITLGLEVA